MFFHRNLNHDRNPETKHTTPSIIVHDDVRNSRTGSCLPMVPVGYTSWFKLIAPNRVRHECRMQ